MKKAGAYVMVMTTVDSQSAADKLACSVVENRLAACVQQVPVKSVYRWKGRVESAKEVLLLMKTRLVLQEKLIKFIKLGHSYEVPEIIAVPIAGGFRGYFDWMDQAVK